MNRKEMTRKQKILMLQSIADGQASPDIINLKPQVYVFYQTNDKLGYTDKCRDIRFDNDMEDVKYFSNSDLLEFEKEMQKQNVWREKIGLEPHRMFCVVYG